MNSAAPVRRVHERSEMHQRRARVQPGVFRPLRRTHTPYGGYTLTELLVVVTIVVVLLAATLPIAKRVMDDSRTRDSARLLAGNFAMAKTYAARNNRPVGLWFELAPVLGFVDAVPPDGREVRQCTQVFLAEVPPPYAGGTTSARGIIRIEQLQGQTKPEFVVLTGLDTQPMPDGYIDVDTAEMDMLRSLVEPAETCLVKFEYKGDWFRLVRGTSDINHPLNASFPDPQRFYLAITRNPPPAVTLAEVKAASVSGTAIPPAYNIPMAIGFRFQVLRTPHRVGNPIELIAGTCIDMEYCGMGAQGGQLALPINHLVVMFSANGDIDGLFSDGIRFPPTGTLHFLIGQVEKLNVPGGADPDHATNMIMFNPAKSNLSDVNSVWVSVGRLTGQVVTSENLVPPIDEATLSPTTVNVFPGEAAVSAGRQQVLNPTVFADRATYVQHCREAATAREQMGGK